MSEEKMTMGKNVFLVCVTAIVTAAITFGMTAESIVSETHGNTKDISYLQRKTDDLSEVDAQIRADFTARMTSVAALVAEQTKQTTELITLIKVQQQAERR